MKNLFFSCIFFLLLSYSVRADDFSAWTAYNSLATEKEFIIQDFEDVDSDSSLKNKVLGESEAHTGSWLSETINMKNITYVQGTHNLTNADIKLVNNSGVMVNVTKPFTAELSFDYEFSETLHYSGKGTGTITVAAKSLVFTKEYLYGSKSPVVKANYTGFNFSSDTATGYRSTEATVKGLIDTAAIKFCNETLWNTISNGILADLNKYYNQSSSTPVKITTSFPQMDLYVDTRMTKEQKNLKNGLVVYMNGAVSPSNSSFQNNTNHTTWDNFTETAGAHQIFIHQYFFENIIMDQVKSNNFNMTLNSSDVKNCSLNLDVETLGEAYPDILKTRTRDETFKVHAHVKDAKVTTSSADKRFNALYTMNLLFVSNKDASTLFSSEVLLSLEAEATISKDLGFNIQLLNKEVSAHAGAIPIKYVGVRDAVYNRMLNEVFDSLFLLRNKTTLLLHDYPIGNMMSDMFNMTYKDQGILLIGQTKKNSDEEITSEIEELYNPSEETVEKAMKFLE